MTLTVSSCRAVGERADEAAAPWRLVVVVPTWVPLVPQLAASSDERVGTRIGDGEAVGVAAALVGRRSGRDRVTVGATLTAVTVTATVAALLSTVPSLAS